MRYTVVFWHPSVKQSDFPEVKNGEQITLVGAELGEFFKRHPKHWFMLKDEFIYIDTTSFRQR